MADNPTACSPAERNSIIRALALELSLVTPEELARAEAELARSPGGDLIEIMSARGLLTPDRAQMLGRMTAIRISQGRNLAEDEAATFAGGDDLSFGAATPAAAAELAASLGSFGGEQRVSFPSREGPIRGETIMDAEQITTEHPGRYTMKGEHGRGAIGRVMIAFDEHIGREVALKELLTDFGESGSTPSASPRRHTAAASARFLREARITGQLEHPGIVPVYEIGHRTDGSNYYTMRLVRGRTMADRLKPARSLHDRLHLLPNFLDLCQTMAYAHSRGVIHRDLKPANIMLGSFGETVVLDWGLAKVRGLQDERADDLERSLALIRQASAGDTVKGIPIGTPSYMSPEQAEGRIDEVDERSDVWSLGAILHELLTGRPPFTGQTAWEVMGKVIKDEVAPITETEAAAPPELAAIAHRCLAKDAAGRYKDAGELAADVGHFQAGGLVSAYEYSMTALIGRWLKKRWPVVATASAGLLILMVFGIWAVSNINAQKNVALKAEKVADAQRLVAVQNLTLATQREREASNNLADSFLALGQLAENRHAWRNAEIYFAASLNLRDGLQARYSLNYARTRPPLAARVIHAIAAHPEEVIKAAYSPDGKFLATVSEDPAVKIWDVKTGALVDSLTGHSARVWCAVWSPDGKLLATGSRDRTAKLWDPATGALVRSFDQQTGEIAQVLFSPDGQALVIASWDNTVAIHDVATGERIRVLTPAVNPIAITPDGGILAASSPEHDLKLFDFATGKLLHTLSGHRDPIYALAFSPDGAILASGGGNVLAPVADNDVRLWDTASGKQLAVLGGHRQEVRDLAFTPNGKVLASAGADGLIKLWDVKYGQLAQNLIGHTSIVFSLAFNKSGLILFSGGGDTSVKIWDVAAGELIASLEGHTGRVNHIALSPDTSTLASAGADGKVILWDTWPQFQVRMLRGHLDSVSAVKFRPDGQVLATMSGNMYSGSKDNTIKLWDVVSGGELATLAGHEAQMCDMAWNDDGKLLASTDTGGALRIWNFDTEQVTTVAKAHQDAALSLAFSPDGKILATAGGNIFATGADNSIKLWDPLTGNLIRTLEGHQESIFTIAFSPDGKLLASASANLFAKSTDHSVKLWDPATGALLHSMEGHQDNVFRVRFSPDGKILASAGGSLFDKGPDAAVRLWDTTTGKLAHALTGHTRAVFDVVFSPDGKIVATASDDATVKLWDPATGQLIRTLIGFQNGVEDVVFSPDGLVVAAAAGDKSVKLFEARTGELLHSLAGHKNYVRDLAYSPDGRTLASAGDDRNAILWRFDPDVLTGNPRQLLDQAQAAAGLRLVGTNLVPLDPAPRQ
jgi:eukaryotic-like serine/threonine-protein kinase